ncbi:MAG: response regulator transcription factor [Bacteroidales bacterium]|nr:response regulator transcription factor [Bacteroidales bacterium]
MDTIKIIIVDDHELFCLGLRTVVESRHSDMVIVGEAQSGAEFFDLLKTVTADIVLLDIALPDISGIDIARRLKQEVPDMKILAVSAENSSAVVEEMHNIGIEGFISKLRSSADTLVEAIRSVMQGFEYFGKDIADIIHRIYVAKKETTEVSIEFSENEKRIIELCHKGLSAKLIAEKLGISYRTVDWHKSNIFNKLGLKNSFEMVRYAVKNGIIRME